MPTRVLLLFLVLASTARAQLVISEFLAGNSNSIEDENGNHEDWIEIQNTSASPVNLAGWYLTDNENLPRQWAFPGWTLNAGGYLVVFASSKDRKPAQAVAGQDNTGAAGQTRLHTNFRLSNNGEYLALTKDVGGGGLQVVQFFDPFPVQATDVSYGTAQSTVTTNFVAAGAPVKALIPSSGALGSTWQGATANEPFDTSTWLSGTTGVGFGDSSVPVATANMKQRLNADSLAAIVSDTSGAAHPATNNGAGWVATNTDAASKTRTGVLQFVAGENDQVVTAGHTDFDQANCTVTFWMRSAGLSGSGSDAAMIWDRRTGGFGGPGTVITQHSNGKIFFQSASGYCQFSSIASVSDDRWHHIAVVMNNISGGTCTIYVDGVSSGSGTNTNTWGWTPSTPIELGRSHDTYWYRYNGFLDDVRFYNRQLTGAEVSQIFSGADEPMAPGDIGLNVQAQMQNINASAYLRVPFTVATPGDFASLRLTNRWNDGFVAYVNGTQIASHNSAASPAFNATATGTHGGSIPESFDFSLPPGLLRAGSNNILALHGLNVSASDANFLILPRLDGISAPVTSTGYTTSPTPGTANAPIKTNLGPFVFDVTRNPNPRPTGTGASPALTITAKVLPSLRPLAASNPVQLKYLVMFGSEQTVNMSDLGPSVGDPAGTRLYSANIPTNTLGPGQMLRWRVVATDNTAVAGTAPEFSDPLDNEQYYGTVAVDSTIQSNLPILYWFTPTTGTADNATGVRNSFFFKAAGDTGPGRFYDNVEINLHGQSSAGFPKKSYDLDFNEDNRFEWDVTQERVKDVNLMQNYGDKSKTHNVLAHEIFATVGSVHHWCRQVRVQQVTTGNAGTPANHFFSIADMMEDGDDDFMQRNGRDPDGALYKVYDSLNSSGSAEKKSRLFEDKSDYNALVSGLDLSRTLAQRRQYAYDNMDLPQCVSYFVGCILTSHQDHGHKNYYIYRDTMGTKEWMILPWDVDLTLGRNWQDSPGYFTDTIFTNNELDQYNSAMQGKGENRLYSLFVGNSDVGRVPATEFRDMVLRRLRTVTDGYFNVPNGLENRLTQLADLMDPPAIGTSDADRDFGKWPTWGTNVGTGGVALRYHIDQIRTVYLPGRRTFLASATLAGAPLPTSQPANAADLITIETVDFKPFTSNQEHEFFVVRNANSYSVDLSGWMITGAVNWTFKPGTVLPPGGGVTENLGDLYVAKNPGQFRLRSLVPDDNQPAASRYRFVQGPYSGQLSARGETIELRDPAGTLLKTKTWTPAPTPAQNQLRISELNYAPVPPTLAEIAALPGVVESDFEYIEFVNTGATPLTLTGARFDTGVTFTFPAFTLAAGARCLLVGNLAGFQLRYGQGFNAQIVGAYSGNLDNNGESLQILDAIGENILDFTYNNSWFPPSDEGGRTLVIRSANPDWSTYDLPQSWALSGNVSGSPGVGDTDFANVYEGWRWDHFTAAEMPTGLNPNLPGALTQDPDGDGWNNFSEYAFCREPRTHDHTAPLAVATIVTDGGTRYLAATFQRRHKALDVTYTVETCGDLTNNSWTPVDIQVGATLDLGNGIEQVTFRDNVPHTPGATRYVRVRAAKP